MNNKLEGLRNNILFKLNAIGDYNTHKDMWDAFYEYEKELLQNADMQRIEQYHCELFEFGRQDERCLKQCLGCECMESQK